MAHYPSGGSTNTEAPKLLGGGPAGARVFNKHGDVIPTSARGMHPDYQAAGELVEIKHWDCTADSDGDPASPGKNEQNSVACVVNIKYPETDKNERPLIRSQGSPPAP